jgi:hypothetical protein
MENFSFSERGTEIVPEPKNLPKYNLGAYVNIVLASHSNETYSYKYSGIVDQRGWRGYDQGYEPQWWYQVQYYNDAGELVDNWFPEELLK